MTTPGDSTAGGGAHRHGGAPNGARRYTGPTAPRPEQRPGAAAKQAPGRRVRCPQCLEQFSWDANEIYNEAGTTELSAINDSAKRADAMHDAYVKCPGPDAAEGFPEHYLPLRYVNFDEPLVIGLVGGFHTGKTTYFGMLIDQIDRGKLDRYGLMTKPLHQRKHDEYHTKVLSPLLKDYRSLAATAGASETLTYSAGYLMTNRAGRTRPVAFFDVGGESLSRMVNRNTRFIRAVGALIFIVDPQAIDDSRNSAGQPSSEGDKAFSSVLSRLSSSEPGTSGYTPIPAAEVLVKADRLRFEPLIGGWLRAESGTGALDADEIRKESRDVYAYLARQEATAWLEPFRQCARCTLHVASATGGNVDESGTYWRGLRPRRVLEPLVSVLAMAGLLDDPQAEQIGR
jgi:hypothetical protein